MIARINRTVPIDGQFEQRETIADDLEVIPTPGHTSGTTMFLWIMTNIVSFTEAFCV